MSSHLSKLASLSRARAVAANAPVSSQSRKAALRVAWTVHSIKRALAAVASASDADYEAFGWERSSLIAKLQWLRDGIERPAADRHTPAVTLVRAVPAARATQPRRASAITSPTKTQTATRGG